MLNPQTLQVRSRIITIIIVAVFLVMVAQLINLQLFSKDLKLQAQGNAITRRVIYPDRGIIFDRKNRIILANEVSYDLMVVPSEARRGVDTAALCAILNIDTAEYHNRMLTSIIKNGSYKPSAFEPLLSSRLYATLNENIYKFPGFYLQDRPTRQYPYKVAANIVGRLGEVDAKYLEEHPEEGYQSGDYKGVAGLEFTYEKVLMGQRGVQQLIRDNKSRIIGSFDNGAYDTVAVAGRNLYSSLDIELQQLGEKLFTNKLGAAVAIDPKTGGILAMITAPNYDPDLLSPSERRKNYGRLVLDTARPMFNRAIQGTYPPGSTFKPLGALVALDEGLITPSYGYPCPGYYVGCRGVHIRCTHAGGAHSANLRNAMAYSCNSYFNQMFKIAVDNPKFKSPKEGYNRWKQYMNSFSLGVRTGVDLPGEYRGNIPDTSVYNKDYGNNWVSCNMITLGIGQDKMTTTPLQMANSMCIIANKGYYFVPHLIDSIQDETIADTVYMGKFREKHAGLHITDTAFNAVIRGMADVATIGTAARIKVPGHAIAAKTGTAQNPHGEHHALFVAFAPVENPTIAIAVVVENAGYGGTWAGPIAGWMMEKYLNDTLSEASQKKADEYIKIDKIPPAIKRWYRNRDSSRAAAMQKSVSKNVDVAFSERELSYTEKQVAIVKRTFDPEAEPRRKNNEVPLQNDQPKQEAIRPEQKDTTKRRG